MTTGHWLASGSLLPMQIVVSEIVSFFRSPETLALLVFVSLTGILLGALPGIGPTLALALAFPFTFAMEPAEGLMVMAVLYGSTTYGGSISAILVNIPGTAGSMATLLDGFPMTQRGEALTALSISVTSSFVGAIVGLVFLALFAPVLADVSLLVGPAQFFLLAVLGLSIVSAVVQGSMIKSFVSASLGFLLSVVGVDPFTGINRYVFGFDYLLNGINLVVLAVGMFALSQALKMSLDTETIAEVADLAGSTLQGVLTTIRNLPTAIQGSITGSFIGSVPGVGVATANFLAYLVAMQTSKNPERFGSGEPRGVVSGEAANNASAMGALIPTMALAIPGGAAAAIFLSAMTTYGITPGQNVFSSTLPYIVIVSILLGDIVFLVAGLLGAKYFARVSTLPNEAVLVGIVVFSFAGSFAVRNNILDVGAALVFGILAFVMQRKDYSLIAFIIAFILGPIAEDGFRRALLISDGDFSVFVSDSISLVLLAASIVVFFTPIVLRIVRRSEVG